jgi:SAM-dependent methyltransferase
MSSFGRYSSYYDLLYREKDYRGEAEFVRRVLEAHADPGALGSLLDLGCGTGRHDRLLAAGGLRVHGVDVSAAMIEQARGELAGDAPEVRERVRFTQGDVRDVRLGETFGAAVSLFHVVSYLPTNRDLDAALATARAHLEPGGLFLFDAWYGPGVLSDPPSIRVKRVAGPDFALLRLSEPTPRPNENGVDVRFTLFVSRVPGEVSEVVEETHRMRYWFHPEIQAAAGRAGFEVAELGEWMTGREPGARTWNAYWVLRATA